MGPLFRHASGRETMEQSGVELEVYNAKAKAIIMSDGKQFLD